MTTKAKGSRLIHFSSIESFFLYSWSVACEQALRLGEKQKKTWSWGGGEGGKKPGPSLLYTGGTYSKILRLNLEVHGTCYERLFEFGGLAAWSLVLNH